MISPFLNLMSLRQTSALSGDRPIAVKRSPCQLQKLIGVKICASSAMQYSIVQEFLQFFYLSSEKLMFLFVLGLLAMSPLKRIDKPPRFHK